MSAVSKKPAYCKHSSGQARVVIAGRVIYLGKHGSRESFAEYDRVIAEWQATGSSRTPAEAELTIDELFLDYWRRHVLQHYRKNGRPTSEPDLIRRALRHARELYGATAAAKFGPLALKAVRQRMLKAGKVDWCRETINKQIGRVKAAFRWATEEELIPPSVYHGLQAVKRLKRGRSEARETRPTRPVPDAMLQATRPLVAAHVGAMIDLQLLTGMRPGEV